MTTGWAIVDGVASPLDEAVLPVTDPAVLVGWSVFETLVAHGGVPHGVDAHLARLAGSASAAVIPMPDPAVLADEIGRVARHLRDARIRVTLTGGGRRIVTGEPVDLSRRHAPVRAVRGAWRDEPVLGGAVKHGSRAPWVVAVKRSGVDEVLLVDGDGRFTEGTTCGVVAVIDGVLWTAPHDGRILESTTVTGLVRAAARLGIPVRREGPPAAGPWDGLYIASVTRHLAPVVELDGEPLPGWDPVGRRLAGEDA